MLLFKALRMFLLSQLKFHYLMSYFGKDMLRLVKQEELNFSVILHGC